MPPAPASLARRLVAVARRDRRPHARHGRLRIRRGPPRPSSHATAPRRPGTAAWPSATGPGHRHVRAGHDRGAEGLGRPRPGLTDGRPLRGSRARVVPPRPDGDRRAAPAPGDSPVESVSAGHAPRPAPRPDGRARLGPALGPRTTPGSRSAAHSGTANVDIDGLQASAITTGDPAVVVAVIDDGVDFSHPDLAARAWTNPGESGGGKDTNGVDDDGNGYVDDVHGWDFCNDDNTVHDFDEDFHGTHVAGTIAASLDGQGVVGVAPSVKIMALKFLDDGGDVRARHRMAIEAIEYAKSFGVRSSNNSWGGRAAAGLVPARRRDRGLRDAVRHLGGQRRHRQRQRPSRLPASFDLPNIVSVAATDNRRRARRRSATTARRPSTSPRPAWTS